jgi:hypothetical protein
MQIRNLSPKGIAMLGALGIIAITGCAHKTIQAKVSIMRQEGGAFIAIASSSSEAIAYDGAKVRAEEKCFHQNKDFVVVSQDSKYQGGDQTARGVASAVGGLFGKKTGGGNLDDYKVTMTFKCDGPYSGKGEPFADTLDLSSSGGSGFHHH